MTIVIIMTIILNMKITKIKNLLFLSIGVISLILGLMIYLLFRENTNISQMIYRFIDLTEIRSILSWLENDFLKYYFVDYLWALSLSCWLHLIFLPKMKGSFVCSITVVFLGVLFETLQFTKLVNGTGDILDVISYLLAVLTVNIINYKRGN